MASKATEADEKAEEYVSDPEDSPLQALRRREAASDDEEGSDGAEDTPRKINESAVPRNGRSDEESDGQGGAEVYDDDDLDDCDEEEEYDELGEEFEEYDEGNRNEVAEEMRQGELEGGENRDGSKDENRDEENKEGEKKENEPYAVPTTGAFYMHDDRFQENGRGGRRRYEKIFIPMHVAFLVCKFIWNKK